MDHPLLQMLYSYYGEYPALREQNQDLDNLNFHRQYGLCLGVPVSWPLIPSIANLLESLKPKQESPRPSAVIIYPSTAVYNSMYAALKTSSEDDPAGIIFFSWHELCVAIYRAGKDSRELQKFRHILQGANLTIFLGAPYGVPEVVDQVQGFCEGCLIVFQ